MDVISPLLPAIIYTPLDAYNFEHITHCMLMIVQLQNRRNHNRMWLKNAGLYNSYPSELFSPPPPNTIGNKTDGWELSFLWEADPVRIRSKFWFTCWRKMSGLLDFITASLLASSWPFIEAHLSKQGDVVIWNSGMQRHVVALGQPLCKSVIGCSHRPTNRCLSILIYQLDAHF